MDNLTIEKFDEVMTHDNSTEEYDKHYSEIVLGMKTLLECNSYKMVYYAIQNPEVLCDIMDQDFTIDTQTKINILIILRYSQNSILKDIYSELITEYEKFLI